MATLTALQPTKLRPRTDFSEDALRKEIFMHGMDVSWSMACECPCRSKYSATAASNDKFSSAATYSGHAGEKDADCAACKGSGWFYHSTQTIKALVTSADREPERFALFGQHGTGSARFTMLPEHLPSYNDKMALVDTVVTYSEVTTRRATVDTLRYPIVERTLTLGTAADPTVSQSTTLGVLAARKADSAGTFVDTPLVAGTDFDITTAGAVDWAKGDWAGTAPAVGDQYAVHYYCHPVYIVKNFPNVHRDTVIQGKTATGVRPLLVNAYAVLDFLGDPT